MSEFDKWFKKNFKVLHEAICDGDLLANSYKKAIRKTYNHQQKKIDRASKEINDFFDKQTAKPTDREYCNKLADVLEILK